ncbi:hypothetical protein [Sulfuracidifex tepidarius]|uniref:hypothetical protein n=1 Tax=Sulfuracidifex tepidarius TaxID=1294262 RepID=UPI0006CF8729|nr:hypothetical protein [Sulfuracidifex tepidarius]
MEPTYVLLFRPLHERVKFRCKEVLQGTPHEVVSECFNIEKGVTTEEVSGLPFPTVSVNPTLSGIYDEIKGRDVIVILPRELDSSLLFITCSFLSKSRVFYVDGEWLKEWDLNPIYLSMGLRFLDDRLIPDSLPEVKRSLWYFRNGITFLSLKEMENLRSLTMDDLSREMLSTILLPSGDDVTKIEEMVRLYIRAGYYDKAISLGRELPVIYCMRDRGYGKLQFDEKDRKSVYMTCRRALRKVLREFYRTSWTSGTT